MLVKGFRKLDNTSQSTTATMMTITSSFRLPALFFLLSVLTNPVFAFWRLACGISQESRVDPIVNPGTLSSHVHKFAGGISMSFQTLIGISDERQMLEPAQQMCLFNHQHAQHVRCKKTDLDTGHQNFIISIRTVHSKMYQIKG